MTLMWKFASVPLPLWASCWAGPCILSLLAHGPGTKWQWKQVLGQPLHSEVWIQVSMTASWAITWRAMIWPLRGLTWLPSEHFNVNPACFRYPSVTLPLSFRYAGKTTGSEIEKRRFRVILLPGFIQFVIYIHVYIYGYLTVYIYMGIWL